MSNRYWKLGATIGLISIFCLISSLAFAHSSANLGDETQAARKATSSSSASQVPLYEYPYSCAHPKTEVQDSLCIQRRATDAAVQSARWTTYTVWVGSAGTIAVVLTLIVSGIATFAAYRSAKVAKDTLISTQRAFVFPDSLMGFWEIDAQTKRYNWRFRPYWNNSGKTPTRRMRMHTECKVFSTLLPNGFDFDYPTEEVGNGIIHPGMRTMGGGAPRPQDGVITASDLVESQKGTKIIYIWGWMKYFDVFDRKREHFTRFCWQIIPVGDPIKKPKELVFNWVNHTQGNCTDDD